MYSLAALPYTNEFRYKPLNLKPFSRGRHLFRALLGFRPFLSEKKFVQQILQDSSANNAHPNDLCRVSGSFLGPLVCSKIVLSIVEILHYIYRHAGVVPTALGLSRSFSEGPPSPHFFHSPHRPGRRSSRKQSSCTGSILSLYARQRFSIYILYRMLGDNAFKAGSQNHS